jgi:hypothetical protein
MNEKGDMDIRWRNTLGHRKLTDVFEEEVGGFFDKIKLQQIKIKKDGK